tara:strand:+ start:14749 stop:14955 length:207 start_codon:yes stop_codon:yes gene_type:complete
MKNKKLIFIGIGLIGIYFLYDKVLKNKKNQTKRVAGHYKDAKSCLEAGYSWGGRGIVASCYDIKGFLK